MDDDFDARLDEAIEDMGPEASGPSHLEVKSNWEAQQRTFDAFKAANDRRLAEVRARGASDPTTLDEVSRLGAELDRLTHAPQAKARAAPENKAWPQRAGDHRNNAQVKDAVVAIGREVIRQGGVIDRMARSPAGLGRARPTATELLAKARQVRERVSRAQVKRDRPPGLGAHLSNLLPRDRRSFVANPQVRAHQAAVRQYLKSGQDSFGGIHLRDIERQALSTKAMHTEMNPNGGYLLLPEHERSVLNTFLVENSAMRGRATIRSIVDADELVLPLRTGVAAAGWISEGAPRVETGSPALGEFRVPTMLLYAYPFTTQKLLDSAFLDIEEWLAGEVSEAMGTQESDAWFNGDGVLKPRGLLTYPFVTPDNWAHGSFRYLPTGVSGAFNGTAPGDALVALTYQIKTGARAGASWLMKRTTVAEVRKIKDTTGQYLWQPSLQAGQPPMLLSFPVDEDEFMPDIAADTFAIGFGDWRKTYIIVDQVGLRVLRDPYTSPGFVKFLSTKAVGGAVQHFDAAAFLKFGTS